MDKKQRELAESIDNLKIEMKNCLDNGEVDKAKELKNELCNLKEQFELYQDTQIEEFSEKVMIKKMENKNVNKEFNNALLGKKYDDALVQRGVNADGGYLVPEEQMNVIEEYRRQQIALKGLCRVIPTETGKGQMPIEVEADMMLANLTEGAEIPQSQINFGVVAWDVKDYGDIIPVSRQILQDEKCGLMTFIGNRFAKKAVHTENAKIIGVLKATANEIACQDALEGLRKALNVRLDPANSMNAVIICNQTAFDLLDGAVDDMGRLMLQPMISDPTKMQFKGRPVIVMSDAELPIDEEDEETVSAEFLVADMPNAVLFADRIGVEVAVSEEAGFTKNVVYARVIERFDVKAIDPKAVCRVLVQNPVQP